MADQAQQDKRTASQRIEDLERALMSLYQTADNMARDLLTVKEAIKLIGNKLDVVAKAANISDDTISKGMIDNNVAELKGKVTSLVENGVLVASEELLDSSFVVGQEVDTDGNVVNPRIQFTLGSLRPEVKAKIQAGKKGEAIDLEEGKLRFIITEVYSIVAPKPQEAEAPAEQAQAPAEASSAPAPEAAAAEQSSSNDSAPASADQQAQSGN
jgi:hypothetical protein